MSTNDRATSMPIRTDASLWPVSVMGTGEEPRPRQDKVTPDGEQTYSSGAILRVMRKDGAIRADKSASVHVIEPAGVYEMGVAYVAEGTVFVQPYENNSRVALSITVQRLVPAQVAAKTRQEAA